MSNTLRLVDEDGEVWGEIDVDLARSLSSELFYTIDYRDDEHPDYSVLKSMIDRWLSAQSR